MNDELKDRFGERVTFDKTERMLHSHDVASLPDAVERLIDNVPEAVVQPTSVKDVVFLVEYSRRRDVPLVPRGAATSGYGGAIPAKGGIVVNFSHMNRVLDVDKDNLTVSVEPGVIWKRLEEELRESGLALRLYPTSAPGSTVAGWVAEGGAGIGSYEYGYIGENIVSATVVTPEGDVKEFNGGDLDMINRAEGITGFIVEVTLKVRPLEDEVVTLAAFDDLRKLAEAVGGLRHEELPLWHVGVSTADFLRSQHEALAKSETGHSGNGHNGHEEGTEVEDAVTVPVGKHTAVFVYPTSRRSKVQERLEQIIAAEDGEIQPDKVAQAEWSQRFYPMRLKRLGPSLVPSEGIVPIDRLPQVVDEAARRLAGINIEGHLVGKDQVTLLCFLLEDERTASFTLGFSKSLTMLDIIEKYGGRPYSVGLYFTDRAHEALGKEQVAKLAAYKRQHDPNNLLNPGKILAGGGNPALLRAAMKMAQMTEPLRDLGERLLGDKPHLKRALAEDLAYEAFACAQCGYCQDVCTLYSAAGWESATPRGKWYFLRRYLQGKVDFDQAMVDRFLMCTTCKRCNDACQLGIPIQELWDDMRLVLVHEKDFQTFPAFEMMGASFEDNLNIWANRREDRAAWFPEDATYRDNGEIGYWAGCTASFVEPDIAENAVHILKEGGVEFTYLAEDEACCGVPFMVAGKFDLFEKAMRHNLEELKKRGVKTLVISCPGCWVGFAHYYRQWAAKFGIDYDIEIKHITEMTADLIREGKLEFKQPVNERVTFHDSCHIGRHGGIYEAPREVLRAIPGVEFVEVEHNRENGLCCGSVLTRISAPHYSDKLADIRLQEAVEVGAEIMAATCPCCEFQLRVGGKATGSPVKIKEFTALVAEALGYETKDPTETVHYLWSVFERAIESMTMDGMVEMMSAMMPEIMAAMPSPMDKGMAMMQSMPDAAKGPMLGMMEKMIPMMMPKMLPAMMPKLMPRVIELMKEAIPDMPESMEEMLPAMLPKVMAEIMPGMLPEAAPRLAPKMTDHLKAKK